MRLEHYNEETLKKELEDIVGKYLDLSRYALFFFGSRVAGTGDDRSDIDVGIEGPEEIPLAVIGSIRSELELLPTLYTIDVVDFKGVSEKFYAFAKKSVEYIHNPVVTV